MSNIEKVLAAAESYAGQGEVGGNDMGPFVTKTLADVGLGPGQAWCAAFEARCFKETAINGWPVTGDTWAIQAWARMHGCYHEDGPVRGDVLLLIGSDSQPFHTGFVTANNGDGTVSTIEGNSYAPDDYSESGPKGVHRHVRPVGIGKYVRWASVLGA